MSLKQLLAAKYHGIKEKKNLNSLAQSQCETDKLISKNKISLSTIFNSPETEDLWYESRREIEKFNIPDGTGGVNPGDRKAVYYLISYFKPSSILEIGTHIGSSTVHIASALYKTQISHNIEATLTSVDIADVNSTETRPWLKYGMKFSPAEMVNNLNYSSFVKFVADTSVHFAANCTQKFDFIFLDGSHEAGVVYQEIPMALKLLKENGVILLHDYFPNMKPLWSDKTVIPGPYLATQRFIKDGEDVTVMPLGNLPWPTKLGSNFTSLALLLRKN